MQHMTLVIDIIRCFLWQTKSLIPVLHAKLIKTPHIISAFNVILTISMHFLSTFVDSINVFDYRLTSV